MASYFKRLALSGLVLLLLGAPLVAFAQDENDEDETVPSDVENVEAFPGDGQVTLSWDPATDDTGVTGYYVYSGLTSVTEEGGSYTFGSTDVGDVTTYVMENLSNGVTYYFAMTAYDAAGNESEYYSYEVDATPEESETGDFTAPTVSSASAVTSTLVEVEFSEEVVLPDDGSTAFSIEASDGTAIEVLDAYLSDDASIVFVLTEEQTAGAQYILTAGIEIMDSSENPIVSGTSDTATFTGSSLETADEDDEEPADDEEPTDDEEAAVSDNFEVDEVEATAVDELELSFTENVMVADPDSFTIQLMDDASVEVEVLAVSIDDDDATMVTLMTEEMEEGMEYVLSMDDAVLNEDGESLGEDALELEFTAATLDLADLIAPEDVTNLLFAIVNETTVQLNWDASENSDGDLAEYLVYRSGDGGLTFGDAVSVLMDATSFQMSGLMPGATYTFKVTAVDENGNESEGVMTTVTLPETGPGMVALGGLSLLGAGWTSRRRRRRRRRD